MKRVLFMIPNLMHGGAEKVLVNLVNNMDSNEFDITVMTLFDEGVNKQFLRKDINYISHYKKAFRGNSHYLKLFSPRLLFRKFIKEDYDIIVSYLEGPTARIVSGCDNPKTKIISWIHCTIKSKEEFSIGFRDYNEALECYSKFDKMIFVSKGTLDHFNNFIKLGNKCKVLYNVNDSSHIKDCSIEESEIKDEISSEISIIGVGKLMHVKGFIRLLKIHKKLIMSGYNIHTYILGKGPEENDLIEYINENNLNNSVSLLGYQTNPYKYVSKCDLLVCSSYSEGFSTAATEALIVGTPVCTVEVSGMKEMLGENNEYGVVVDNDDEALYKAIKELLDNPQLLAHYKEKAIERGKEFSTEKTVKAVEEMLESLH